MGNSRILIVEDEPKVASFIKRGLEEQSYEADIASDGETGARMAISQHYDAVILDISLPLKNGFEVSREIRRNNVLSPVLMLTALGTMENKLAGFDSGADDYLVKPFEFRELLARLRALIKRSNNKSVEKNVLLKVADLEMNLNTRVVKRGGKKIDLTAKEFALLEYFIRHAGKVLSRAEIAEKVWEITFDTGTNVIDVYVNFLRKKIDKDFDLKLIQTHVGVGYTLNDGSE